MWTFIGLWIALVVLASRRRAAVRVAVPSCVLSESGCCRPWMKKMFHEDLVKFRGEIPESVELEKPAFSSRVPSARFPA